jgi:hypothetical protein
LQVHTVQQSNFKKMKPKNMTTPRLKKSIGRSSSRLALLLIPLVFACFALSPMAQAVSPPPDGGYPGQNTAEGDNALFSLSPTDGAFNTAIGWVSLFSNTTGSLNTGVGAGTLWANTTADNNTAVGAGALALNTTGEGNTANGALALLQNTVGKGNTAIGAAALLFNTTGQGNTALGARALLNNTTPVFQEHSSLNTAVGLDALGSNTIGGFNTAVGAGTNGPNDPAGPAALGKNTCGSFNTAVGAAGGFPAGGALGKNTTGRGNTAVGAASQGEPGALGKNTTGDFNTALGEAALNDNTTGSSNIAVGMLAGANLTTGNNNIYIGNNAADADESATIRIGTDNIPIPGGPTLCPTGSPTPEPSPTPIPSPVPTRTFIAGIRGTETGMADAVNVVIDSRGQLGTMSSSKRFKTEIKPMDNASETILALKPVTFHYKSDTKDTPQYGLIAEEVAKVNPNLVVRDKDGQIYTVRYDAVNAMLLNEFLKEHRKVDELQKQVEALTAGLQKVSAQVELNKPASQTVMNNP